MTAREELTIAVDFMSDVPENVIAGVNIAACYSAGEKIVVVGPAEIGTGLKYGVQLQEAEDFLEAKGKRGPFRIKTDSSIYVACKMVKEGRTQALVSAGDTRKTVIAAVTILGRMEGVERPAIAVIMPAEGGKVVLADVGATVDPEPEWLLEWAFLVSAYVSALFGEKRPKIGLLNIGRERDKGSSFAQKCYSLLENQGRIDFVGNVENVFSGSADAVLCDGFTGNALLKNLEGGLSFFGKESIKEADYSLYGGALLLGVKGIVVVAHGRSSSRAIENAIYLAADLVSKGVSRRIEEAALKYKKLLRL